MEWEANSVKSSGLFQQVGRNKATSLSDEKNLDDRTTIAGALIRFAAENCVIILYMWCGAGLFHSQTPGIILINSGNLRHKCC